VAAWATELSQLNKRLIKLHRKLGAPTP